MMPHQLGFGFDSRFCTGCQACQVACRDKHDIPSGRGLRRVLEFSGGDYERVGEGWRSGVWCYWVSVSCNHCQNPPCVEACPTRALVKRESDGIVLVKAEECSGCGGCLDVCPYSALLMDSDGTVLKCDSCLDLIEKKEDPACVSACPMRVLSWGRLETLARSSGVATLPGLPEAGTCLPSWVIIPPQVLGRPEDAQILSHSQEERSEKGDEEG